MARTAENVRKVSSLPGAIGDQGGRAMHYLLLAALAVRLIMIVFGEWQDKHMAVKYTDVDYLVFSDAAAFVAKGQSPYQRLTYRYSPLLSYILLPNMWIHPAFGKVLFSGADLLVGKLTYSLLRLRGVSPQSSTVCAAVWLFNPFTFTIATRGNCEALVCLLLLTFLHCIFTKKLVAAALWFGLLVHTRIYPIIYTLPILVLLDSKYIRKQDKQATRPGLLGAFIALVNKERVIFAAASGSVFFALIGAFYMLYGTEFLNEAFLYHLTRTDPRHNFSIYFYHLYLQHGTAASTADRLLAFIPQFAVLCVLGLSFGPDLPFAMFTQTVAFVAFNKVCTAQYFVWFFCLLPLILPFTNLKLKWKGSLCIALWCTAQAHWLGWAYLLEFQGQPVFVPLWVASILFFGVNVGVLIQLIQNHRYVPVFASGQLVKVARTVLKPKAS